MPFTDPTAVVPHGLPLAYLLLIQGVRAQRGFYYLANAVGLLHGRSSLLE